MRPITETVMAMIPGTQAEERLMLVLIQGTQRSSRLELRQQSWGEGVGWFTQSTIEVQPAQVAGLRNALGTGTVAAGTPTTGAPGSLAWGDRANASSRCVDRPTVPMRSGHAESA